MHAIMIDIETLATDSNAVVLQFAAVPFSIEDGYPCGPSFNTGFNVQDQIKQYKRTVDDSTLVWWLKQQHESQIDVAEAIETKLQQATVNTVCEIIRWIIEEMKNGCTEIWSSGSTFDIPILESLMGQCFYRVPWEFYMIRDLRTLRSFVGLDKKEVQKPKGDVKEHTALWDCHWQINQYRACMERIESATGTDMKEIRYGTE